MHPWRRPSAAELGLALLMVGGALAAVGALFALDAPPAGLPGQSFDAEPGDLDGEALQARDRLRGEVESLVALGERSTSRPLALAAAADHIERELESFGLRPRRQRYRAAGVDCDTLYADVRRGQGSQLLVGAHYDSARGSPGGNDNASGVAVVLALAERLAADLPDRWVRVALFVNEEPPHFRSATMGSRVYAAWAAEAGELPAAVAVLDSVGFYSSEQGSQRFPTPGLARLFGDRGDFIAFVADDSSEDLLMAFGGAFREHAELPSEGAAFSRDLAGVAWSDHASFWAHGVPAILVTDTATFRDPSYHERTDTGRQIDYDALTRLTRGLEAAVRAVELYMCSAEPVIPPGRPSTPISGASVLENTLHFLRPRPPDLHAVDSPIRVTTPAPHI